MFLKKKGEKKKEIHCVGICQLLKKTKQNTLTPTTQDRVKGIMV